MKTPAAFVYDWARSGDGTWKLSTADRQRLADEVIARDEEHSSRTELAREVLEAVGYESHDGERYVSGYHGENCCGSCLRAISACDTKTVDDPDRCIGPRARAALEALGDPT